MTWKPKVVEVKKKEVVKEVKWKGITLHHSLSQDGDSLNWRAIRRYHIGKGWEDVGYHFGIEKVQGEVEVLVGRPLFMDGAHTKGSNEDTIGICIVGNYNVQDLERCVVDKLIQLCAGLCYTLDIHWDEVMGHKERDKNRTCPGDFFNLSEIRNLVREKLNELN
jgi:hypothetical protein